MALPEFVKSTQTATSALALIFDNGSVVNIATRNGKPVLDSLPANIGYVYLDGESLFFKIEEPQ